MHERIRTLTAHSENHVAKAQSAAAPTQCQNRGATPPFPTSPGAHVTPPALQVPQRNVLQLVPATQRLDGKSILSLSSYIFPPGARQGRPSLALTRISPSPRPLAPPQVHLHCSIPFLRSAKASRLAAWRDALGPLGLAFSAVRIDNACA